MREGEREREGGGGGARKRTRLRRVVERAGPMFRTIDMTKLQDDHGGEREGENLRKERELRDSASERERVRDSTIRFRVF